MDDIESHVREIFNDDECSESLVIQGDDSFLNDNQVYRLSFFDIDPNLTAEELRSMCQAYGLIHRVHLPDKDKSNNSGIVDSFVEFYREEEARAAQTGLFSSMRIMLTYETKVDPRKLYVTGFPARSTGNELKEFFEQVGNIFSVRIMNIKGFHRNVAFVSCETEQDALAIKDTFNETRFKNTKCMLKIKLANALCKRPSSEPCFNLPDTLSPNVTLKKDTEDNNSHGMFTKLTKMPSSSSIDSCLTEFETQRNFTSLDSCKSVGEDLAAVSSTWNSTQDSDFFESIKSLSINNNRDGILAEDIDVKVRDSASQSLKQLRMSKTAKNVRNILRSKESPNLFLAVTINSIPCLIPASYAVKIGVIPATKLNKRGWIAKPIILNRKYEDFDLEINSNFSINKDALN